MSDKKKLGSLERVAAGAAGIFGVAYGAFLIPMSPIGLVGGSALAGAGTRLIKSAVTGRDCMDE